MNVNWTEVISVIGLILVALMSGLGPAYFEQRRENRERIASEHNKIHAAAKELLRNLTNFHHTGQAEPTAAASLEHHQQVIADLRASYDAWGLVVMPRLTNVQKEEVLEIRNKQLGRAGLSNIEAQDMSISNRIFGLTWEASKRVK